MTVFLHLCCYKSFKMKLQQVIMLFMDTLYVDVVQHVGGVTSTALCDWTTAPSFPLGIHSAENACLTAWAVYWSLMQAAQLTEHMHACIQKCRGKSGSGRQPAWSEEEEWKVEMGREPECWTLTSTHWHKMCLSTQAWHGFCGFFHLPAWYKNEF